MGYNGVIRPSNDLPNHTAWTTKEQKLPRKEQVIKYGLCIGTITPVVIIPLIGSDRSAQPYKIASQASRPSGYTLFGHVVALSAACNHH